MIKVVVFDFDDTITDNRYLDYASFRKICLRQKSYIPSKKEIFELRSKNYNAEKIFDYINNKNYDKINKKLFMKQRNLFLNSEESIKYLKIKPHIKRIIKKLFSENYKFFILSIRKKKKLIQKFLEINNLDQYFEKILNPQNSKLEMRNTSNAIKSKKKLFKNILSVINVENDEILYIGDSKVDYDLALFYGVNFVWIKNPYTIKRDKIDKKIKTFKDLEFIIKQ